MIIQTNLKPRNFYMLKSPEPLPLISRSPFSSRPCPILSEPTSSLSPTSPWFSILRTAIATSDLALGKCTHARIFACARNPDRFLINNLITMYSKCGSLTYARRVFDGTPDRDLVTWNSILAAYAQSGKNSVGNVVEGFGLFRRLRANLVTTSRMTLAPTLKLCLNSGYVWASEAVHGYAWKIGLESDEFVSGALVNIYSKFGRVEEARVLFEDMDERDVVLWSVMIRGYMEVGLKEEALKLFCQFQSSGLRPNDATLHYILNETSDFNDSSSGGRIKDQVQAFAVKLFSYDNGDLDVILWNGKMAEYHQAGDNLSVIECFKDMIESSVELDRVTFLEVLSAVSNVNDFAVGKQIHGMALKSGFVSVLEVANSLINMYSKMRHVSSAQKLFQDTTERDLISWNSVISCYSQNGLEDEAVYLFINLLQCGLIPDQFTLSSVLRACSSSSEGLALSKQVHVHAVKTGNVFESFVSTALIDSYSRNGCMTEAEILFQRKERFDLATWNAMMFGYTLSNNSSGALRLFSSMHERGEKPDQITLATVVKACGSSFAPSQGKQVHANVIKSGFETDLLLGSGILDMYVKFGDMAAANTIFSDMSYRDDVAWTTMIAGCVDNQKEDCAFSIYRQMRLSGVLPDEYTLATLIKACSSLTALEQGRQIQANAVKLNCTGDPYVGTSLVDMYAKCGDIDSAYHHFRRINVRKVTLWNAMLVGLAQYGRGEEALRLFTLMETWNIEPDRVTFIGVLSACSHSGLVSKAYEYFDLMTERYGIQPEIEHYSCLVDALGRASRVEEAEKLIELMPFQASASMYRALLGACRVQGDTKTGKRVAEKLMKLEPSDPSAYVLLSNIYAASNKWDEMSKARRTMRGKNIKKNPGFSWVDVKNKIHMFVVDDRSHLQSEQICNKVEDLVREIKKEGYTPDTEFVMLDVEEEEKERALYFHSEKLAVAYALLSTPEATPIRVIKNLRVCGDCHSAMKCISKVCGREIVLRDANRFHRFKDGVCSCGDYW